LSVSDLPPPEALPAGSARSGARRASGEAGLPGSRRFGLLLAAPPAAWLGLFFIIPMLVLLAWSFQPPGMGIRFEAEPTLTAWSRNLGTSAFQTLLVRTIIIAFTVATITVIAAYPIAYLLARVAGRRRYVLMTLILAPSLVSYLLRLFAWRLLLGTNGVVNTAVMGTGIVQEPLDFLLYNQIAVTVVLIYVWAPWAALPIFVRLEQIDGRLLEAASDLGASRWRTFLRVTLPLSLPGVFAAFFFVFIPTLGDFATATYVGGSEGQMFGNVIQQFLTQPDFPSGAVLSMVLLAVSAIAMVVGARLARIREVTDVRL
jgi:spermidine/putrescine transport system permease protein